MNLTKVDIKKHRINVLISIKSMIDFPLFFYILHNVETRPSIDQIKKYMNTALLVRTSISAGIWTGLYFQ